MQVIVLLNICRDIDYFVNVIYWSRVDDVKRHLLCIYQKSKYFGHEAIKIYIETENAIEAYLVKWFY